jgi:hypothetical protein
MRRISKGCRPGPTGATGWPSSRIPRTLSDAWAERSFAVCFRSEANLSPAAKLLVAHLRDRARTA